MAHNLVVPKIHVQRQLIVNALNIEYGHVTDNALQWSVYIETGRYEIWKYSSRFARFSILVMLGFALYAGYLATLVSILI